MSLLTFPPASLQAQLEELRREKGMRNRVYPHMVSSGKLKQADADFRNRGLDGAIATLEKIVQATGQPGRNELVAALRTAARRLKELGAETAWLEDMLAKVPE